MNTQTCDFDALRRIFSRGLTSGLGTREGATCIEGALSLAMGLPLSDEVPCVAVPDRFFAIRLNDAAWSRPQVRAAALWPLAHVQIGTAGTNRVPWAKRVVEGTIRRIVPEAVDAVARRVPGHAEALRAAAQQCRDEGTREAARHARDAAAAYAAAYAAYAAAYAAYAAAADAAAYAAAYADAAYADAADAAAYAADAEAVEIDRILTIAVQVALDAYAAEGRVFTGEPLVFERSAQGGSGRG
jgi:hypothetical protein